MRAGPVVSRGSRHLELKLVDPLVSAHVYTNLNATSKGVSLGIKPASELTDQVGSSQPFVELMGRKVSFRRGAKVVVIDNALTVRYARSLSR